MAHVHLIGIGGSGLSAIARVLWESGYSVSGSDRQASPLARSLEQMGINIYYGHRPENVLGADLVIRSSAIHDNNIEVLTARAQGVPVLKRSDFLGQLMQDRQGIAVAGTHGKTTTTAMIAWILAALGQDPTYIIGGVSKNLGANAHAGRGKAFVIEADEYDRMFLGLNPEIAVVTNVEHDHPDCYPSPEEYHQSFLEFAGRLKSEGILLVCGDNSGAARLGQQATERGIRVKAYGIEDQGYPYQAVDLSANPYGGFSFQAIIREPALPQKASPSPDLLPPIPCTLQVPGVHNVQNALAALAVAHQLGLAPTDAARKLAEFQGVGRRFEVIGEAAGIVVIDDYAHHPSEIRATLSAARARYPGRPIWAVWQPHTYSRTRLLLEPFRAAFGEAEHVLVTEVYAAREPVERDFSTQDVIRNMSHPDVRFVPGFDQAVAYLSASLRPGDVLVVLSAGDADRIGRMVLDALRGQELPVAGRIPNEPMD